MLLISAQPAWPAQTSEPPVEPAEQVEPLDLGTVERERVDLVLIDVMVMDRSGTSISDLTIDDFDVTVAGKPIGLETLDITCPQDGPDETDLVESLPGEPAGPDQDATRIVLALDYLHLMPMQREDVFDRAKEMVKRGELAGQEVMLAALNGGLRIEQQFTDRPDELLKSLHRMRHDISLWGRDYFHLNEFSFVSGLTALFDVLGTIEGTKAVVFFSAMGDVPLDLQFKEIAAVAANSRTFVYPVDVTGLGSIEGSARGPTIGKG